MAVAERGTDGTARLLHAEALHTDDPHHDDLLACIDRACAAAGVTPRELESVAVSVGPGGFTSVRIAVTTARMICEATGARCVPVPSAHVVAQRVRGARGRDGATSARFAVALASKGETAHVTVFNADGACAGPGAVTDAHGLAALNVALLVGDTYLPQSMRAEAARLGMEVQEPDFDPVACLEASAHLDAVDPIHLAPIYPREPEAVTKWRAMHPPT